MSLLDDVSNIVFREDSTVEGRMLLSIEEIIDTELKYFSQAVSITSQKKFQIRLKYQFRILLLG